MERAVSVLWVDENVEIHQIYETLLSAIGVETFAMATCAEDAVWLASSRPFDLVIIDGSLFGDAVLSLARRVKSGGGLSQAARIAIVGDDEAGHGAVAAGVIDAVLARPVTARALRDEVVSAARRPRTA
ncbi:MAG: hypothetical protein FD124_1624 [Alphaproteobacteria bacterium]|nr:MAG: hypothetical protein FD160_1512 [Caulobacteraceae bacterium]TPW06624.1 MAG: hypothetical protein FD124_1624 [Alphaproteobacteria bacterium]